MPADMLQHGMVEEVQCIMVKRSPYLGTLNKESETPLHRMKLDELKFFLDSRVSTSKQNESEIHLNLGGIDSADTTDYDKTVALEEIGLREKRTKISS
ncbi:hypothetical protein pipiens_008811 [Culex pipiens pipiens]|uniref:Uncharacterized protein n=1 Tax=Culex pipiens pipiens TaxID=38569 RepID=A0ABD1DG55_CULPP